MIRVILLLKPNVFQTEIIQYTKKRNTRLLPTYSLFENRKTEARLRCLTEKMGRMVSRKYILNISLFRRAVEFSARINNEIVYR